MSNETLIGSISEEREKGLEAKRVYIFARTIGGVLLADGYLPIKYYDSLMNQGRIAFKDTEIDSVKDLFYVKNKRIVKTGKAWKENYLKNK